MPAALYIVSIREIVSWDWVTVSHRLGLLN